MKYLVDIENNMYRWNFLTQFIPDFFTKSLGGCSLPILKNNLLNDNLRKLKRLLLNSN